MKRIYNIITVAAALIAGVSLTSCIYEYGSEEEPHAQTTVRVNTMAVTGVRPIAESNGDMFTVLFWLQPDHLERDFDPATQWSPAYLASQAPQPVSFYGETVYDTCYPYPYPETTYLYATGYSPSNILKPDADYGYGRLTATFAEAKDVGRHDFLGCDLWKEVYKGSQEDPFTQQKNKLYFRHLASKLTFYADRDQKTMENKQYVRNVQIRNLSMSLDGGTTWTPMYTPSAFEWKVLSDADFSTAYTATIDKVRSLADNSAAIGTRPQAGYKATQAAAFAGAGSDFVLHHNATDRVPVYGMVLDSCYVCHPMKDGAPVANTANIRLKMDISAEMSFDFNFPMPDDSSATDDLTFTREWKDVPLDAIYEVALDDKGVAQTTSTAVRTFKPGSEYRVYIHFSRTGVNLVAKELPWNYGGIHYITIIGGDTQ